MLKPTDIKALSGYKIWIKYPDGVEGVIDLSHLAGKGVFKNWEKPHTFNSVHINEDGAIEWEDGIDLCPDALYMRLTGKSPQEIFSNLKAVHA